MGVWGQGLFDSDEALDAVGQCAKPLADKVERLVKRPPSGDAAAELAAVVGLLLQIRPYAFDDEGLGPLIVKALRLQAPHFAGLPAGAGALLERITSGEGESVASAKGHRSGRLLQLLGSYLDHPRDAPLFATPAGAMVVQELADACARVVEGIMHREDLFGDELIGVGGPVGVLLLIEPFKLDGPRVAGWRTSLRGHVERLQKANDEEVEELEEFVVNFGGAIDLLLAKLR
jgi:hypothetical protein